MQAGTSSREPSSGTLATLLLIAKIAGYLWLLASIYYDKLHGMSMTTAPTIKNVMVEFQSMMGKYVVGLKIDGDLICALP